MNRLFNFSRPERWRLNKGFKQHRGGPGGWWTVAGPEIHFIRDTEVDVPDLDGWRRERMPHLPEGHRATVVPDWLCEILSKSTASTDREVKTPIYARFGVAYAWLSDTRACSLEAHALDAGAWREIGRFSGSDPVSIAPFDVVTFDLGDLWAPSSQRGEERTAPYCSVEPAGSTNP